MFSMDCAECPVGPVDCEGCLISVLLGENKLVDELSEESCGFVLASEVRSAIEVLQDVGVVSRVEILSVEPAA